MIYHYRCPQCRRWLSSEWDERHRAMRCPHSDCQLLFSAPSPEKDQSAWVDSHEIPLEMASAARVVNRREGVRADLCSVPGCCRTATEIDHRIPYHWEAEASTNPGKTCVENLFPICHECNVSKGDRNYAWWLAHIGPTK